MCFYHPQTLTLISSLRTLAQSCLHPSIVCFPSFPWQVLCLSTSAVCLLTFILAILKDNKSFTINEWWNNVLAFILAGILSNKKWFSINDNKISKLSVSLFVYVSCLLVCLHPGWRQANQWISVASRSLSHHPRPLPFSWPAFYSAYSQSKTYRVLEINFLHRHFL